jgi:hypothetical protein
MIGNTENGGGIIECQSLQDTLGSYKEKGFVLCEESDDFLILYHEREEIGRYYQHNEFISKDFLQKECRQHLLAHLKDGNKWVE